MKKAFKIGSVVLSVLLTAAMFTACASTAPAASSSSAASEASAASSEAASPAQPAAGEKLKIGVIQYATHPSLDNCYTGFVKGLEEAGFKNGENIEIDFQNAMAQMETSDQIAKTMASKGYNLIMGIATPSAVSAFSATRGTDIPVVFCAVSDPVAAGLVKSTEAPGANCTGTSDVLNLDAQLKLIRALQPNAKKVGILYTTSEANSVSQLAEIKKLAPTYNFEIVEQGVQSASDIPQSAASLAAKVDCINNFTDNNVVENLSVLLQQAKANNIPVYGSEIEQVKNGCLAAESIDYVALGSQTGKMAARILKGEKAETIAVEKVKDTKPVVNTAVLDSFKITLPEAYKSAEQVTTTAK
ncbi:ABC transporter substrate-binding protein [Acetanaerobacterium elongatum]|uniref:Putative ABC transport system substrate-binding protein n=1 Tax=Acetanaerobacterium elongatum TaxID=258515 RepID=A0A1G9XGD6_9FIRM|nr:ABC transporter substrate-binding protein [Acetanaerobacterium elongatum]SDM95335.1 putative ABC transport system substrate-binding protein [Acetanaerobacterium elongatum]